MQKRRKLSAGDGRRRFARALASTLSRGFVQQQRDLVHLLLVCQSSRTAVASWLEREFAADVSIGKERLPVPVLVNTSSASLLLTLLDFEYCVHSRCPLPWYRHALSPDAAARSQQDELVQRVVRGRRVRVAVSRSAHDAKGWCVVASERIAQGAFIGEYSGNLISTQQMQTRFAQQAATGARNYVLVLREVASKASSMRFRALRTIVDATACGSFTRLMNHSCEPNVTLTAVRVDSLIPRLVFIAKRAIARGEELSFDYSGDADARGAAIEYERMEDKDDQQTRCLCGATSCRGVLPSDASV